MKQQLQYLQGEYTLENTPSPIGGGISASIIWGENMKSGGEKGEKFERKRKQEERKKIYKFKKENKCKRAKMIANGCISSFCIWQKGDGEEKLWFSVR
jgi:hypothetical protein